MTRITQIRKDVPIYIKVVSQITHGQPTSMMARNLDSGKLQRLEVDKLLEKHLRSNFPAGSYVGAIFIIEKTFLFKKTKEYPYYEISTVELTGEIEEQLAKWEAGNPLSDDDEGVVGHSSARGWFPTEEEYQNLRGTPEWKSWYRKYLQWNLWKRTIKPRILERDGSLCVKCGGHADAIHHRNYDYDVMTGNNDEQLVAICQGCHNFISFDDAEERRGSSEVDRLLYSKEFCSSPKIDARRRYPLQWKRMSAIQKDDYSTLENCLKLELASKKTRATSL